MVSQSAESMTVDELIRVLDPCPDLLLIDCFGTLLHRRVPMRRVRRIVSENLLTELDTALGPDLLDRTRREVELEWGRANAAAGGARDHRLEELAAELHDRLGIQIERDRFVRRFCEIEVEAEVRLTRRNAPIVRAIEASIPPERVCVVSDTNLTERMLRDLLEARRAMCPTWRVVTSCDAGATKRSGELYQRLTVDREPGARWVMVGDNAQADGEQARASAIEPLLVAPGRWDATRDVSWRVVRRDVTRQVARVLQPVGSGDVFPELALTLFVFADRLDQSMRQLESSRAVFLAREGAFLKTLFDVAQEEYATRSRPALASAYLLTSRKSTFVP